MNTGTFFQKIRTYYPISKEAEESWTKLLHQKKYKRGENFVAEGENPKRVAFVIQGLFSQH